MRRRPITLIFPYYENPTMLAGQLEYLAAMPGELRALLSLIVVDDGSPTHPLGPADLRAMEAAGLADVQLWRIGVDVRWNWLACRNLAVEKARTVWVLMTDIDHMVPERTLRRIMAGKLNGRCIYRFSRVDAPKQTPYKPHPNSWLMTREMFDATGGYDERFSGYYGTDGMFRDRCAAAALEVILLEQPLVRVPREVVADASTTTYGRKEDQDRENVSRIRAEIAASGDLTPRRGLFPHHQVT